MLYTDDHLRTLADATCGNIDHRIQRDLARELLAARRVIALTKIGFALVTGPPFDTWHRDAKSALSDYDKAAGKNSEP